MYSFNFNLDSFLKNHWQKKPALIRSGFAEFDDPITPDELAGLAMEDEIDSRLVLNSDNQWQVKHGPFEHFDELPETHAQLIVQAANHWHTGPQALAAPFYQFPRWLMDDVMVCFSLPQGGVGPHIDQYDVFIIQGMGKRRWRVGAKGQYTEANLHTGLRQIEGFDAILDEEMESGDILYIPAGYPHEGHSLTASLSYSVGFRSPKSRELFSSFADFIISQELGDTHYLNPDQSPRSEPSAIYSDEYQALITMMESLLKDEASKQQWLGEYLSQSRHELDIVEPDLPFQLDELIHELTHSQTIIKVPGLRTFYHPGTPHILYINGDSFEFPPHCHKATKALCNLEKISGNEFGEALNDQVFLPVLLKLVNLGYWYIDE